MSDGVCVCVTNTIEYGLLLLLGVYFLLNLNYPKQYAQVLGFFQVTCLKHEFPVSQRSTAFTKLKESLHSAAINTAGFARTGIWWFL